MPSGPAESAANNVTAAFILVFKGNRLPLRAVNLTHITFREKIEKKQGKQKSIFFSLSFSPRM